MTFDHWISLIELSSTLVMAAAAFLQAVLLFLTFRFGTKYLAQHRNKYMLENKLKLIESTLKDIHELLALYERIFSIRYDLQVQLKRDNDYSTFKLVLDEFWRKDEQSFPDKRRLKSQISISVGLVKDPRLDLLVRKCNDAEMYLYHPYIHLRGLSAIEDQPYGVDLFRVLPFSIYQKTRTDTKEFLDSYQDLLKELKSFYFKDPT